MAKAKKITCGFPDDWNSLIEEFELEIEEICAGKWGNGFGWEFEGDDDGEGRYGDEVESIICFSFVSGSLRERKTREIRAPHGFLFSEAATFLGGEKRELHAKINNGLDE